MTSLLVGYFLLGRLDFGDLALALAFGGEGGGRREREKDTDAHTPRITHRNEFSRNNTFDLPR